MPCLLAHTHPHLPPAPATHTSHSHAQVTHVFSDKTGTLTSNHMEFMRCYLPAPPSRSGDMAIALGVAKMFMIVV